MGALRSSGVSPPSDSGAEESGRVTAGVICALILLVTVSAAWCYWNGYILYYGDAESHLNISRALIDSRTPGYDQLGTVWLPVLHLLCLPFVSSSRLWSNGLAGTLPVAACFVIAGACFYLAARDVYHNVPAALVALACFTLNPNVLYLAVIPMTEIVFVAGLFVSLLAIVRWKATQRRRWMALALIASWSLSLTRYDGWFLIPFAGLWLTVSSNRRKILLFIAFVTAASAAPLYWAAHNWWETGNALDFYNGPYSPRAIQGAKTYPGYGDWIAAIHYYSTAAKCCAGSGLILLGVAGFFFVRSYRVAGPLLFLLLTPLFYVWSMHSSGGTPIYLPSLWPFSHYNSRYGLAVVPLCAFAAGAIVLALPVRWKNLSWAIPLVATAPWLLHPSRDNWICWKESQVNSNDRRAWTNAAAQYLASNYRAGQSIFTSTGDITGIYRTLGIPLSQTLNIGNGPAWFLATTRPDLFHPNIWLVVQSDDALAHKLSERPKAYAPTLSISTSKFSPTLQIARRSLP